MPINNPFEIHVHTQMVLRPSATKEEMIEATKPMWQYRGVKTFADGAQSEYEDEPGILFDPKVNLLQICWSISGRDDFRHAINEVCMNLNELTDEGAAVEVTFYDVGFDEDDEDENEANGMTEPRDDFLTLFVGSNPAQIMQAQRNLLVNEMVILMEQQFDSDQLGGVIAEIDKLFGRRLDVLVTSLQANSQKFGMFGGLPGNRHGSDRAPRKSCE